MSRFLCSFSYKMSKVECHDYSHKKGHWKKPFLPNLLNRSCISSICADFLQIALYHYYCSLCTLKKKEGKWENKINALQLFLVRFHQNMFNYVLVRLKWFSFCHSAQTYIFYQVKNFSDDSSLQNYYILLQKKRRNSSWQKSWQITLVLRHFWHYSRSKDK